MVAGRCKTKFIVASGLQRAWRRDLNSLTFYSTTSCSKPSRRRPEVTGLFELNHERDSRVGSARAAGTVPSNRIGRTGMRFQLADTNGEYVALKQLDSVTFNCVRLDQPKGVATAPN